MADRTSRIQEVTGLYLQILQQLNNHSVPQWLELDLTFQQMKVLYVLKQHGPLRMSELSGELKVSMPTITGIISRLVERRDGEPLVARVTSAEDRREVRAHLTKAGLQVTEQLDELNRKTLTSTLAQLTDGEMEDARAGLNHISTALTEQRSLSLNNARETVTVNLNRVIGEDDVSVTTVASPAAALS